MWLPWQRAQGCRDFYRFDHARDDSWWKKFQEACGIHNLVKHAQQVQQPKGRAFR
jgi:hypothetical protein